MAMSVATMSSLSQLSSKTAMAGSSLNTARRVSVRPARNVAVFAKVKFDKSAPEAPAATSAFTRRRELFAGRLAMGGFASAVIGELLTGKGPLGQLQLESKLPQGVIDYLVLGIVAFNFVTALNPASPTFSPENQEDVRKRPKGPTQDPRIYPGDPKKFFGVSNFGFTKKNELFVGRVAMLGFASALIGEKLTGGKGALAQIGVPLGQPLNPGLATGVLAVWIGFFLFAAVGYNNFGQQEGNDEIY